jgi:hypothetical protein
MRRAPAAVLALLGLVAPVFAACGDGAAKTGTTGVTPGAPDTKRTTPGAAAPGAPALGAGASPNEAAPDEEFPLHGFVTGLQLRVRTAADPQAHVLGWLRMGSRVRVAPNPTKTATCRSGWHRVRPRGWACAGEGIDVSEQPNEAALTLTPPAKDAALPYTYYFVKEPKVPEYHRLPSRDEQREARDFLARHAEIAAKSEERAAALLRGELAGEAPRPTVVRNFLERAFFFAGAGVEERASRQFVRGVRGSYVKLQQLEPRQGSAFHGVELGGEVKLPVAWAVRDALPFSVKPKEDGTFRMVTDEGSEPVARHSIVPWTGRKRIGDTLFHALADGRYLKHWFLAVAEAIARPREIAADQPWIHINLEQQTLVAYLGDEPVYATLVSSGLEGHATPTGLFDVRAKYVAETMSDLGPEAGDDRYKIEDVPWTQYFSGSLALHGAFWHDRFGLPRSHGCVNLAPLDAHRLFDHTWPAVPEGWHGVTTDGTDLVGSKILITEK